jgi:Putative beta-barrel porin-2, OmpL-like. bbp2
MYYRKAVLFAVASVLASSGFARADVTPQTTLSLDPTIITADAAASDRAPLMMALDKVGMAKPLDDLKLNIYGWVEAGYTYNHRHFSNPGINFDAPSSGTPNSYILPGPFNHEVGNHFMLNQVDLRFERIPDSTKFDVGGLVEIMYGTDASIIHSSGLNFGGTDPTTDGNPSDQVNDKFQANYGFDITQAYVDVNLPVGNGLKIRVGKFVTLLGNETIDPRGNLFYSHSYIFNALPFTQTGVLGFYQINDQWSVVAGITRGWDMTLEDNGVCAIDGLGQIAWTPNKQLSITLNWNVGPQNFADSSHYRTVIDPIITWKATNQLTLTAEALYIYDGGMNAEEASGTHAYGDVWGAAVYASYVVNDYVTANGRFEKFHSYSESVGPLGDTSDSQSNFGFNENGNVPTINIYSATLGVTITPMPKDAILKNLSIRPEIRYDFSEDHVFKAGNGTFKDQLTFAADVIFKF